MLLQDCHWEAVFGYCQQSGCAAKHTEPKKVAEYPELPNEDVDEKLLGKYKPVTLLYFSLKEKSSGSKSLMWAGLTREHFQSRFKLVGVKDLPKAE